MADLESLPDLSVVGLVQTIAYQEFDFMLAYVMALSCFMPLLFSKLAWQALASTPGAACDLLGEAAAPQAGSRSIKCHAPGTSICL